MTQARTYPEGVTSWVDVETDDVPGAQRFYGALFGWTFNQATPPGIPVVYAIAQLDGQDVAGIGGPATPTGTASARWNTYVAVDDIKDTIRSVERAGGRVVDPVEQAGEGGWNATVSDPAGVAVRLWQAKRRLGAQVTNTPGAWNFSDLHAADPAASRSFYEEVFGWAFTDLGFATMIRVPGYGDHLAATVDPGIHERQAGVGVPPGFADAIGWLTAADEHHPPTWQVTFTVTDRDESAAKAESLGGRVVRREESDWTKLAVIADPEGAEFTVSQFTPPEG
jgi:predicted enzyme related to lactoylglutathione lyase